ncbi:type II secretion system secretin GspD [Moritella viscosa]|uniref:type II secretion system secretin GspD n=1 Tax=Moritella viscosa TaxID=80854 RepID=UPI000910440C|nr:type II secretion system secretin GspD [Moritella viscosa]SGZ00065.1 Putative type II secretory pathway, component EpsD [Moritella viscosa]SGZ00502.1 Putative type II secretory pathway, component EpsD [Moritella viscosa]
MNLNNVGKKLTVLASGILLGMSSMAMATDYSASFKGTDINEFINVVGKNLNKTVIIDPSVRGKVNVRSYDLLNEEQYYQFFLNVLDVYGYSVVKMDNGVLKVIKSKVAKTSSIPVVDDKNPGQGDEMVTRVVPVHNVSVRELSPLLRQLNDNAGGGNVVHYEPSNVLMLTGRAAVVNRLVEIVHRVDKAGDQAVDIIHLKYASASEMVRIIDSVTKGDGKSKIPSILQPKIVADDRTNAVVISGDPKARQRVAKLIQQLDSELESTGNTRVIYLKYANAKEVADVLKGVSNSIEGGTSGSSSKSKSKSSSKSNLGIEAHEDTNALVITAQPDVMRTLEQVISQLDIRRAQVLVEAIIVEISEGDGIDFGIQWATAAGGTQYNNGKQVSLGALGGGIYDAQDKITTTIHTDPATGKKTTTESKTSGDTSALASALGGVNGMILGVMNGSKSFGAIIQAAAKDSNSNILATPSIMTLDNQEATFIVGEEVPVITGSSTGSDNKNPFQTVERQEVGIKLKVTPQINEGDAVQLTIEQEVSHVLGSTAVDVTFAKRQVNTTILADSGQTIVIGGLLDEKVTESISKVPWLGDIPWIGNLFKSTSSSTSKRNLMIFIKPTIIRDNASIRGISNRKYSLMRANQLLQQEKGVALMPFTDVPVLPKFDEERIISPAVRKYLEEQDNQTVEFDMRTKPKTTNEAE